MFGTHVVKMLCVNNLGSELSYQQSRSAGDGDDGDDGVWC